MRFITVRDLRSHSGQVWKELGHGGELVLTANGKPIALLSGVTEDNVEETLVALRHARATAAVGAMQRASVAAGTHRLTSAEIQAEIAAARRERHR